MTSRFSILLAALLAFATPAAAADKTLSKGEVEQIVHDYLMNNADVILASVDAYQKKTMQDRQAEAMKKHGDALTSDKDDPVAGNPKGDVTLVEFFDYNCGYCRKSFSEVQMLIEKDKNLRVVFKEFPILSPSSEAAAKWALAADKQGKYFEFHKAIMNNKGRVDDDLLEKIAKDTGLDMARLKRDIEGSEILLHIERNRDLAQNLGISGTPAFVIGDTVLPGAVALEKLEEAIERARKK